MLVYCNTQRITYFFIVVFVKTISKQFSFIPIYVSHCLQFRIYTLWECLHFYSLLGPQYWSEDDNLWYYYNANFLSVYSINYKNCHLQTVTGTPREVRSTILKYQESYLKNFFVKTKMLQFVWLLCKHPQIVTRS